MIKLHWIHLIALYNRSVIYVAMHDAAPEISAVSQSHEITVETWMLLLFRIAKVDGAGHEYH
eukprot:scaffold386992_cov15-Prasinocladus_malaysianus.AAC.1